ncbi:MAG: hypothetical protein MdMp024_0942 [Bacteroidales bacterium]
MKYFVTYYTYSSGANSAEKTALKVCETYDGLLIDDISCDGDGCKEAFIEKVKGEIERINKACTRCKDLRVLTRKTQSGIEGLYVVGVLSLIISPVKQEFK